MSDLPPLEYVGCIARVVSYDPVRRKGFMKRLNEPGIIHFVLTHIPEPLSGAVMAETRRLREMKKGTPQEAEWKPTMTAIRKMIHGQHFRLEVAERVDGKFLIKQGSVEHLPDWIREEPGQPELPTPPPGPRR